MMGQLPAVYTAVLVLSCQRWLWLQGILAEAKHICELDTDTVRVLTERCNGVCAFQGARKVGGNWRSRGKEL